ncbi:MAG: hypothetical protein R3E75_11670 [Steroidobacteraceae bacterium]
MGADEETFVAEESGASEQARSKGCRAMQFNFVVSTSDRSARRWQSMEFDIVGRLPPAFHHPVRGYVDALVMYRAFRVAG